MKRIYTDPLTEIETQEVSGPLQAWREKVGDLPKGFFLEVYFTGTTPMLGLCYNGPHFRDLVQLGGKKPEEKDRRAFLTCWGISYPDIDDAVRRPQIINGIKREIERTQEQLATLEG